MKAKPLPDQGFLLQCFDYDPSTGELLWKARDPSTFVATSERPAAHQAKNFNARFVGRPALASPRANGYLAGSINSEMFYAHRVIWKLVTGQEPDDVDHKDGNRQNNAWNNLRSVSRTDNLKNRCLSSNNTSGFHGVSYSRRHKLWSASIGDGPGSHLGWFPNKQGAVAARLQAEIQLNYHPNHGRPHFAQTRGTS